MVQFCVQRIDGITSAPAGTAQEIHRTDWPDFTRTAGTGDRQAVSVGPHSSGVGVGIGAW
jgi:hypothetical protein